MDGDVIPAKMADGIELGIIFEYFNRNAEHVYKVKKGWCNVLSTKGSWFIFYRNKMNVDGIYIN